MGGDHDSIGASRLHTCRGGHSVLTDISVWFFGGLKFWFFNI
jgi:hypothetical protein